jgi:hypothetical protein
MPPTCKTLFTPPPLNHRHTAYLSVAHTPSPCFASAVSADCNLPSETSPSPYLLPSFSTPLPDPVPPGHCFLSTPVLRQQQQPTVPGRQATSAVSAPYCPSTRPFPTLGFALTCFASAAAADCDRPPSHFRRSARLCASCRTSSAWLRQASAVHSRLAKVACRRRHMTAEQLAMTSLVTGFALLQLIAARHIKRAGHKEAWCLYQFPHRGC